MSNASTVGAATGPLLRTRERRPPHRWAPSEQLLLGCGALAVPRLEARDATACVEDLLLAGVEGVASRADLDVDGPAGLGAAGGEVVAGSAGDLRFAVCGVNAFAHRDSSRCGPGSPSRGVNRRRSVTAHSTTPGRLLFPAGRRAAVDGRGALGADEAPVVAVGPQGHRQHADRLVPADLAAALHAGEAAQAVAAGADDELHRAAPELALSVVRGEAFVVVIVPVEDDVDAP